MVTAAIETVSQEPGVFFAPTAMRQSGAALWWATALHIRQQPRAARYDGRRLRTRVSQPSLQLQAFLAETDLGLPHAIAVDAFQRKNPSSASLDISLCARVGGSQLMSRLKQLDPFLKEKKILTFIKFTQTAVNCVATCAQGHTWDGLLFAERASLICQLLIFFQWNMEFIYLVNARKIIINEVEIMMYCK